MMYENLSTPVFTLERGVQKIVKYGMKTFKKYALEAGLSYCDMNRCIAKARLAYDMPGLREMPCPPELRSLRFEHYKRNLGYSEEQTLKITNELDQLYRGTQPVVDPTQIDNYTDKLFDR